MNAEILTQSDVELFLNKVSADIYLLEKGVRDCAYEICETKIFDKVKHHIEEVNEIYVIRDYTDSDDNMTHFFVFHKPTVQLFINIYFLQTDYILKEYILGKILGYSEDSAEEYFKELIKNLSKTNSGVKRTDTVFSLLDMLHVKSLEEPHFVIHSAFWSKENK